MTPLTEQQIRAIAKQEIQSAAASNRFQLGGIQRHIHNNVDSPFVYQPILNYVGIVSNVGLPELFPSGWSIAHTGTGVYVITHNLGETASFAVNITAHDEGSAVLVLVQTPFTAQNQMQVDIYDTLGAPIDNGFYFTLTIVNNRSQTLPTYVTTLAP